VKPSEKTAVSAVKKFARQLMTTTCLTAAAVGAAHAGVINETSVPGGDFSNTFGGANVLPVDTTEVIGQINPSGDTDFFEFSGLTAGGAYSLTGIYTNIAQYGIFDSSDNPLNALTDNPASLSGVIPGDGILVVEVQSNEQVAGYDLTLDPSSGAPEPASMAGAGLGLAGAWLLRRKRKQ
jgi:hypothetical protein